jgi:hypothetical protein
MPSLTEPAVILVQPIEEGLEKRHERSAESNNWHTRPLGEVCKVDIGQAS